MAHELFSDVSTPQVRYRASSRWTMPISIAAHVVIVALVVIIPLMAADVLPTPDTGRLNFIPAAPTPPAPPAPRPPVPDTTPRTVTTITASVAPIVAPDKIGEERPPAGPVADGGVPDLVGVGCTVACGNGLTDGGLPTVDNPPPPPQPPAPPARVRVGGAVRPPVRVRQVPPIYPAIAQAAKVSGRVSIEATIDTDGTIRDARVLEGSPLLREAALAAVRQWRYTPTLLNNQPVQVLMTVNVDFVLH